MKRTDMLLPGSVAVLSVFGLFMIYDASSVIAFRDFSDKYHYFTEQLVWMVLGFLALSFFSFFDYRRLFNLSLFILLSAIFFLVLVFIPGLSVSALGARRWVDFGSFSFQPAEYVKLSLAIYLSAWFSQKEKGRLLAFSLLLGLVLFLVMMQPDMGTASIILFEALILYFLSGGNIMHFLLMVPFVCVIGYFFIALEPYRAARLTSFINLGKSLEGASYHVKQILIALGSGGLIGVGAGNSLQKYEYLPENVTDSIFAIIAEEFGFFGSFVLIFLFCIVIWRGFIIAGKARDVFGKLLAGGITGFLGIQMFINLAAMTALLPLTGVPLPFISYGGSALIVDLASVGILLNIARKSS